MGWEKVDIKTPNPPQYILDAKVEIDKFYDSTIKPFVGEDYPPELGGTLGTVVGQAKTWLNNFSTLIVDPLGGFIKTLSDELFKVASDFANTGVSAIVVHPYNIDGAEIIKTPTKLEEMPAEIRSLWESVSASILAAQKAVGIEIEEIIDDPTKYAEEIDKAIKKILPDMNEIERQLLNLPNLVSVRVKKLSPKACMQKVIDSLDDADDPYRPQGGPSAAVAGFGILVTAKTYYEFMDAVKMVAQFFNFDDIKTFVDGFDKKFSAKKKTQDKENEAYKEWLNEHTKKPPMPIMVANSSEGIKLTLTELRELYAQYERTVPMQAEPNETLHEITFRTFLEQYYAMGITKSDVYAQKPNWKGFNLANSVTAIKDFYEAIAFYHEQINGYVQAGTSSLKEAIDIIIARFQQLLDVITKILMTIEKFANLPSLARIYTVAFSGTGGNNLIKQELSNFDSTGLEQNDFSFFVLLTAQSADVLTFGKVFNDMFESLVDKFGAVDLLSSDCINDNPKMSPEENPGATDSLDANDPNSSLNPTGTTSDVATQETVPPALPSDITNNLTIYSASATLNPPLAFYSGSIMNGGVYPSLAPYWESVNGVTVTAYLQECNGDFNMPRTPYILFNKGDSIMGDKDNTPTYYNLKIDAKKDNNELISSIIYNFIIDPTLTIPPIIFPTNVSEGGEYQSDPEGIRWNDGEFPGFTIRAMAYKNIGSPTVPNWKYWDYVGPGDEGTGVYLKGYILPDNQYIIDLISKSIVTPSLETHNRTSFFITSTAYLPENRVVSGIENRKTYIESKTFSWDADTSDITTTATLKLDNGIPISLTSADVPYTVSNDGTYKLIVTTTNARNSNYKVSKTYTFVIDRVYPKEVPALSCLEIRDDPEYLTPFTKPVKIYWSDSPKAKASASLLNKTYTMVYNDLNSQLTSANISYDKVLYWELDKAENIITINLYKEETGDSVSLAATGSREGNGEIILIPQNDEIISGSIVVEYLKKVSLTSKNIIAPTGISTGINMGLILSTSGEYVLSFAIQELTSKQSSARKINFKMVIPDLTKNFVNISPYGVVISIP